MKKLILAILLVLGLSVPCFADSTVTFTWDANSESDLKEYRLYQSDVPDGQNLQIDTPVAIIPADTEIVSINVVDGTWFWVLTAVDEWNLESGKSNEVSKKLDSTPPKNPNLNVIVTVTILKQTTDK